MGQKLLPEFTDDGLLPPGDYVLSLEELALSPLVTGSRGVDSGNWDASWRRELVRNLSFLVRQLWRVGVTEIFVEGSFAEDKDHPNDIDGYFECELKRLASGDLERELNLLDQHKVWTWPPRVVAPFAAILKSNFPCGICTGSNCTRMSDS